MTIATTMCKLLLAMVIGFFLFKKGILNADTNKKISAMIVQVTCPCIILNSVSSVPHDDPGMVLKLFLAGVVLYVILPFLSWALVRLMRVPEHRCLAEAQSFILRSSICRSAFCSSHWA